MDDTKQDTGIRIEIVAPRSSTTPNSPMLNKPQMNVPERSAKIVEQPSASLVKPPRERLLHIGVRIPATLLEEIDVEARETGSSMSQIIRERLQLSANAKHGGRSDAERRARLSTSVTNPATKQRLPQNRR